jgi:hypothetical protein
MRIAVCISGQPRAYKQGYEYLKRNLLDHHDCDIFIHTWKNGVYDNNDVFDLYKPVKGVEEEYFVFSQVLNNKYTRTPDAVKFPASSSAYAYYSMFRSCLYKIDHEVKTQQYDWVVKTRFDYALNSSIPFDQLDPTKIYIPNCRMVPSRDFGNDQFAFGSSYVMNQYMSTYINMETYYKIGYQMNGEEMMSANLHHNGLVGERLIYVDMKNPFPPGLYNGTPHSLIRDDMPLWKKK